MLAPVVTPFRADLSPDEDRFVGHCRWLVSQNCGLAVFGTNSEANSMSVDERKSLLEAVVGAGVDPRRMMPGTGCCSLTDTVELTRHAIHYGAAGVLMLPPFYYKGVSNDGLFRYFSEVVERVGDDRLRIYLYHIPPVAQVAITLELIERLLAAYPATVVGIKDSSGDWANTKAMLERFPGFRVFVGSEQFLLDNMRNGGVGCISATANINPGAIHRLFAEWRSDGADALQAGLTELRGAVARVPMIPALKAVIGHFSGVEGWGHVRPPLLDLGPVERRALIEALTARGFEMPGLR